MGMEPEVSNSLTVFGIELVSLKIQVEILKKAHLKYCASNYFNARHAQFMLQ